MDNLDALEAEMLNKNKQTTTVQSQTTSTQSQDMPKDNLDSIEEQEGAVSLVAPIPDTSVSPLPSSSNIKPPTKIEETKEDPTGLSARLQRAYENISAGDDQPVADTMIGGFISPFSQYDHLLS